MSNHARIRRAYKLQRRRGRPRYWRTIRLKKPFAPIFLEYDGSHRHAAYIEYRDKMLRELAIGSGVPAVLFPTAFYPAEAR